MGLTKLVFLPVRLILEAVGLILEAVGLIFEAVGLIFEAIGLILEAVSLILEAVGLILEALAPGTRRHLPESGAVGELLSVSVGSGANLIQANAGPVVKSVELLWGASQDAIEVHILGRGWCSTLVAIPVDRAGRVCRVDTSHRRGRRQWVEFIAVAEPRGLRRTEAHRERTAEWANQLGR